MEKSDAYRKGSGAGKKWDGGGPGGPGGGPYGGGPRGPPRGLDNVRGIDHSKFILSAMFISFVDVFFFSPPGYLIQMSSSQLPGSLPACGSCCGWGSEVSIVHYPYCVSIVMFGNV